MRNLVWKPIIMMLAVSMLAVFVACGGDEEPAPTKAPAPTAAPVEEAKAEPTEVAAVVPEATAAPVEDASGIYDEMKNLTSLPGYQSQWGEPSYTGGIVKFRTNVPVRVGSAWGSSHGNSHYELAQFMTRNTLIKPDPWVGWHGGLQPELAHSWEVSGDGLTYTFNLREGVMFRAANSYDTTDELPGRGTELHCDDVQAFMEFVGTERWWDEGGYISLLLDTAEHTWTCPDGADGYTVQVHLDSGIPNPGLPMMISAPGAYGIPEKDSMQYILDNYPVRWQRTGDWSLHVGTGAFMPLDITPEIVQKLQRNPDYFKPGLPMLDGYEVHTIPDPATAFAAWATGKIDIMGHGSGSMYPAQVEQALRDFPDKPIVPNSYWGARAIAFNTEKPPFDDVRVRKAVHLVMDRQEWNGLQRVGDSDMYAGIIAGFFNAENEVYNPMGNSIEEILSWPGFRQPKDDDIAEANRLMDEVFGAGVRPTDNFKCLSRADDTSTNACLFMEDQISKHLDMTMALDLYDPATLSSQLSSCTWVFAVSTMPGWEGVPDPYLRYRSYNSAVKGWKPCLSGVDPDVQARVNKLIVDMRAELEFNARSKISQEIESILYNDYIPAAPMEWMILFHGTQPWMNGWFVPHHAIHTGHAQVPERTWLGERTR